MALMVIHLTIGCVGAVPGKSALKTASVNADEFGEGDEDPFPSVGFEDNTLDASAGSNSPPDVAPAEPLMAEAARPVRVVRERVGAMAPVAMPSLRWIAMGDFGETNLAGFEECADSLNVQRSACSVLNSRCKSSFETSCSAPEGCRRLFKCITGQTNTLAWFPMGDGVTLSAAQGASPSYGLCSSNADIAGRECSSINSRCLSSFCTSGSGNDCGRRVFKCLTTGVAGRYFYRWMGDKSEAELAGVGECALQANIAGSECFSENSTCKSSFQTANGGRRLFKCTP